jgi:predicted nucleic acid-binding protein
MTNLTLTVDEDTLRLARIKALEMGPSVNALVRQYLKQLAGRSTAVEGVAEFFAATKGAGASPAVQISLRDALIMEAASRAGCERVLSEDLNAS